MTPTKDVLSEVEKTLDGVAEAFEDRDLNKMMSLFSASGETIAIGTGADEKKIGAEEIKSLFKRDWAQSEASSIVYNWRTATIEGSIAWATAESTFYARVGSREMHIPTRITAVMRKSNGRWMIVNWHASVPAAGQQRGEAWPTNFQVV